jgi:ubiquinone biosynthesis protein
MSEQIGVRALARNLKESVPAMTETLPELPLLAHKLLEQATTGKLRIEWTSAELRGLRDEIKRSNRRTITAILGTGLLLGAAIIYGLDGHAPTVILGAPLLSWLCGGLGLAILAINWTENR